MCAKEETGRRVDSLMFYMDLLEHDLLNMNQAEQGYLELILATPGTDSTSRKYAERVVSHLRTSTILIENARRLVSARRRGPESYRPADLMKALIQSEKELVSCFPSQKVKVEILPKIDEAYVVGDNVVGSLVLNVMVNLVRLDNSEKVDVTVKLGELEKEGRMFWAVSIEDPRAELPPALKEIDFERFEEQDISTSVKLTGIVYAKMIANSLGGDFQAKETTGSDGRKGAALVITLRKANRP